MRHYDELASYERGEFTVIVDKTWEDIDPWDQLSDCFDSKQKLYADIDSGKYEWFMLRVRVFVGHHELGIAHLGGCLYERAEEVLTDGTAEDLIHEAMQGAKNSVYPLMRKLQAINEELEREGV